MRLEDGKYYRTRDGRKVGPMRACGTSGVFFSNEGAMWYSNGEFYPGMPSEHDIVAEWVDNDREQYMIEVMQAFLNGKQVECTLKGLNNWGIIKNPIWNWDNFDYRVYQGVKDSINWDHVAPEFNYMARDSCGTVWLFKSKPEMIGGIWHLSQEDMAEAHSHTSYRRGTVDWKDSLVIRPGFE